MHSSYRSSLSDKHSRESLEYMSGRDSYLVAATIIVSKEKPVG